MKSKKQQHGCVKPIESILSADVLVPDNLVMQKEELSMPVPFTVEILDAEYDSSRINDLFWPKGDCPWRADAAA